MKMSSIVRTTSRMITPFLLVYGFYLIFYGHISPGGGFQGGVIVSVSVILLITANGYQVVRERVRVGLLKITESGAALFLVLSGLAGVLAGSFMANYLPRGQFGHLFSGGNIALVNTAIGLKVGVAFTLVFYVLLRWTERD